MVSDLELAGLQCDEQKIATFLLHS